MAKIQDLRPLTNRIAKSSTSRDINKITTIVRHHSGGMTGDFDSFWTYWKSKGWTKGGYHEIILRDGTVQLCYDPIYPTNGVANQNSYIYNICLVGNGNFTAAQEKAWTERCLLAQERFKVSNRNVKGHNEMPGASTACPGINMHLIRNRLLNAAQTKPVEEVKEEMMKPSSPTISDAVEKYLVQGVKDDLFDKKWLEDFKKGKLSVSDFVGLQLIVKQRSKQN